MGMFMELLAKDSIGTHRLHEGSLEHRVEALEAELKQTQRLVKNLLKLLEKSLSTGIAGDVHIAQRLM